MKMLPCPVWLLFAFPLVLRSVELAPLAPPALWQRAEWRITGVPAAANPFDPELIALDATFTTPSGRVLTVPAFWYQDYARSLVNGVQVLTPAGEPGWRLRFTPDEPGEHRLTLAVATANEPHDPPATANFVVAPLANAAGPGWIRRAEDRRYLETSTGRPLRLIGANVCWAGPRGTYDFDQWFQAMQKAGENFARLWLSPWDMNIEHQPGTLNRYDLGGAWRLDHVLQRAGETGISVLIALDHHGMFMANDPAWGGSNNFWTRSSPYAAENGGPCANPNEFFTHPAARKLYQKRLRYLIARYGHSPHLLSWQFFNEIDNSYLPRSALVHDDVLAWHREMARWLKANDPYRHLVSTSLTGASDRADYWTMPEMDFSVYHSYGEADPARHVAKLSADMARRYGKPVMIGEIGTDHRRWTIEADPYLRGFRQGLWGGTLGGSMGTAMTWWWEDVHTDNAYPVYRVIHDVMARAGWERGRWDPAEFVEHGPAPVELGDAYAAAGLAETGPGSVPPGAHHEPFSANLPLNQLRLNPVSGEAALADALAAARAAERISSYLHGTKNPQLQQHARLTAHFADRARLVFRVNSVAADAELLVRIDGEEKLRVPLVNQDGLATLNDEIDREFAVDLPEGKHRVELAHTGADWVNLKSLRLERMLPAPFAGGWEFTTEAIGLRNETTAVVYLRSPHVAWPAGALRYNPPLVEGAIITLKDWTSRAARVVWLDPKTGAEISADSVTTEAAGLPLHPPAFNEDVIGIVTQQ